MRQAVFGYGSLVNRDSLAHTLGRPADNLIAATLGGWQCDWSVVVRNATAPAHFELLNGHVPQYILALNVVPAEAETVGALFEVSDTELAALDRRESHYDRVAITGQIRARHPFGRIYTYTGKDRYLWREPVDAIVPASYVRVVEAGFHQLGGESTLTAFRRAVRTALAPVVPTRFINS